MDAWIGFVVGMGVGTVLFGTLIWVVVTEHVTRARPLDPEPVVSSSPPPSQPDLTTLITTILDSNARIMGDLVVRGLEAVTSQVERAAFGTGGPTAASDTSSASPTPPPPDTKDKWNAAPWEDWAEQDEVAEETDENIAEWMDLSEARIAGVSKLPDFTGERIE